MITYTKTITKIYASELKDIIKKTYNKEYSFIKDGWSAEQGATLKFRGVIDTVKKQPLDGGLDEDLDSFLNDGNDRYVIFAILIDLCNKDIIPESDYHIYFDS